jgi:hypothetical protein
MNQAQEHKKIHYNIPQLMFSLIMAQTSICLWARATGKSEGPMAQRTIDNIMKMPRSNGFLLGTTYEQLLTRTLPPLIAGWEKLSFYQDIHYTIGKFHPSPTHKAYILPLKADHYIQWFNGTGIYLVSQDRPGTMNGIRSQWGAGDEARLLNYDRFQEEIVPTMAGLAHVFGDLSNYLSLLFCSDMPRNHKGKWLLDYEKLMDPETIEGILILQIQIIKLQEQLHNINKPAEAARLTKEIRSFESKLNVLRKGTVYFSMATTLENIHTLGIDAIKNFIRVLSDTELQISVLNKKMFRPDRGFYPLLKEDLHGYNMIDYNFIDNTALNYSNPQKDCRWDSDIMAKPLEIAMDYNNSINCIMTGQDHENEIRFLSSIYVLHPDLLNDAVKKWHLYYKNHPVKEVVYYFDHTAKDGRRANSNETFYEEVIAQLDALGWIVTPVDLGQTPGHFYRYELWGKIFQENDSRFPAFRYNKTNCSTWQNSAEQCNTISTGNEIKKDKRPEKDPRFPQEEAPHMSDAGDTLMWGMIKRRVGTTIPYIEEMIGN